MAVAKLEIQIEVDGEGEIKDLSTSLDKTSSSSQKAGKSAKEASLSFGSLGGAAKVAAGVVVAAFAAVGAAVTASVVSVTNAAGPIADLASKTQTSVEFLQKTGVAAGQVGVSMDQVANASLKLQRNIGDVGTASKEVSEAFGALGLSARDLRALSPEEQFNTLAAAIAKVEDPAVQANLAMTLFGKSGAELLPLIRSDFQQVQEEAERLGIILSDDVVDAADAMGDRFDILGQAMTATAQQFGGVIVQNEAFQAAVEAVIEVVGQLNQWIIANKDEISSWVTAGILVAAQALEYSITIVAAFVQGLGLLGQTILGVQRAFIDWNIALAQSPIVQMIPGLAQLGDAFTAVAQRMRDNVAAGEEFFAGVQRTGEGIDRAAVKVSDFRQNLLNQIEAGKTAGAATKEFSGAVTDLGDDLGETEKKLSDFEQKVKSLTDSLGTAGLTNEAQAAVVAIEKLGGAANVSRQGMEQIAGIVERLRQNGQPVPPVLDAIAGQLAILKTQGDATAESLGLVLDVTNGFISDIPVASDAMRDMAESMGVFAETNAAYTVVGAKTKDTIKKTSEEAGGLGSAMNGVNDILSEARGFMDLFGISADSTFGKVLAGATKVFDSFNSILGIVDKIGGLFGGEGIFGKLLGGGGGGAESSILSGLSGGLGKIGGAIGGIFGKLGSLAGAAFTNPFGIAILGGIGAFFGLKKLFGGLFGGRDAKTVGEEAGRDLGVGISEGLAQTIHESGKNIQLFLPEVFAEGKLSADRLAEEIGDIFSGFEQGKFGEGDALSALTSSSEVLLQNLDQVGVSGVQQMERILAAADRLGLSFQGIDQFAAAYVARAGELGVPINNVVLEALGLDAALQQVAATTGGVDASFQQLPDTASAAVEGISTAFNEGSTKITEGLTPISDKMAGEIRAAGEETSSAIDASFQATSSAIQDGLGDVAGVFAGQIVPAALSAANATGTIAEQARRAAEAARNIHFPDAPNYGGSNFPVTGAQLGFEGRVRGPRGFFVEPGVVEDVSISKPGQGGRGKGDVFMGGPTINITGSSDGKNVTLPLGELLRMLEKNESDSRERLRRIIGLR